MIWTLKQLCDAVDGVVMAEALGEDPVEFERVITDSRQIGARDCYVAIRGERFDGHAFISDAIQQGATTLLVSEPMMTPVPAVLVEDTRIALGEFAAWHRLQCPLKKLLAVTGSNGKTTCKNMLLSVLQELGKTLATEGNLNNDFGVPRTLLNIHEEHEYAVIEMGANHQHEIRYLTQLAQPEVALITLASEAHLEGFGSLQGVIDTKGEIFEGLREQGVAIINLDSPGHEQWIEKCQQLGKNILTFGREVGADVQLLSVNQTPLGVGFAVKLPDASEDTVQLAILGAHNAMNACGVIAACWAAGLKWSQILPGLVNFRPVSGRLMPYELPYIRLLDDSYNANPNSVKAGIDVLVGLPGKSVLCLGAMAELGSQSNIAHEAVANYARVSGVDLILLYGEAFKDVAQQLSNVHWFPSHTALAEAAQPFIQASVDAETWVNILVKGSRSSGMEAVTQLLNTYNQPTGSHPPC